MRQVYIKLRKTFFRAISIPKQGDLLSRSIDLFLIALILTNIVALILESVPMIARNRAGAFRNFEWISVIVFSAEYLIRIWTCVENRDYRGALRGRFKFALRPIMLIDLAAILPFYLSGAVLDFRSLRALRLFRIFRIMKLGRYSSAYEGIFQTLREKRAELLTIVMVQVIIFVTASCLGYHFEHAAQPQVFSSIPKTMWWAISTVTPLGGTGMNPATLAGRVLAIVTAILGVGIFALPSGILAAGFVGQGRGGVGRRVCPKCGARLS